MLSYGKSGELSLAVLIVAAMVVALLFWRHRIRSRRVDEAEVAIGAREKRVQLALDASNDGLWHWDVLTDTTHFSSRVRELLDYAPADLGPGIGTILEIVHPDDRQTVRDSFLFHLENHTPYDAEFRLPLKSGEYRWFRARGYAERDASNRATRMAGSITDITDRKRVEDAIRLNAMQQGLIAEFGQLALNNPPVDELWNHALDAITRGLPADFCRLLAADIDDKSLVLVASSGWQEEWALRRHYDAAEETEDRFIVGVRQEVLIGDFDAQTRYKRSAMLRAHGVRSGAEMLICGSEHAHGVLGIYARQPDRFTSENINFLRGIVNILASSMDRNQADQRLTHMAQFDSLTGLPNRTMFLERLWHTIAQAEVAKSHVGVAFIDLDRFKPVNDTLGHGAGDQLLLQVAQRLLQCTRVADCIGRLGGDEFTVALADLGDPAQAGAIIQDLLNTLSKPFDVLGQEIFISASAGIAIYPKDGKEPDALLKNADTAMYKAKQSGKNTYFFYASQMNEVAAKRLSLEKDLRGALERNEFTIHYQPKIKITTGVISGFEALLRWQHPQLGMIPPADFISILEDTGLIIPVGEWVVASSCRQLREWQDAGLPLHPIAVNLSPRQFAQMDLQIVIPRIIERCGVPPELIELELTESMLMTDFESAARILDSFQTLGIRISVDDFGTGYSSLAYLNRFPLDALKIDRAFIREVTVDADGATIVLAIINLAHSLKLKVVAEGVETEAQFEFLRKHGCDEMQGYYFSRPRSAEDCTRALREEWQLKEAHSAEVTWLVRKA